MGWEEEYRALESCCAVVDLPWSVFDFKGPDSRKFLNGLLTNDVLKLESGKCMAACLLTPKGMLKAYFLLYDTGYSMQVVCPNASADYFAETMRKMSMLCESKFRDLRANHGTMLVAGPDTNKIFQSGLGMNQDISDYNVGALSESGMGFDILSWPRMSKECRVIVLNDPTHKAKFAQALTKAGAIAASPEAFNVWRVERGLPLFGVDMNDATIPLEARLDDAISFDKGCYMGQETISRVHNLGHLNKIMVQLKVTAAEPPAAGSAVLGADGKELGKVTSAVVSPKYGGILALATVRLDASKPGTLLGVASGLGAHRAEVLAGAFQP